MLLASFALVSSNSHCSWKLVLLLVQTHLSCRSCKLNLLFEHKTLLVHSSFLVLVLNKFLQPCLLKWSWGASFGDDKLCAIPQGLVQHHYGREWLKLQWTSQALLTLLCSSCTSSIPKNASLASSLKVQELKLKRSLKRRRTSQRDRRGPVHRW